MQWGGPAILGGQAKRVRDPQLQVVRVLELDGCYTRGWGQHNPVLVAVDLGEGQPMAIGYVDELFPQAVRRWLESLVKRPGVSVIVTDDLIHYKTMAEKLDLAHRIIGKPMCHRPTTALSRSLGVRRSTGRLCEDAKRRVECWQA